MDVMLWMVVWLAINLAAWMLFVAVGRRRRARGAEIGVGSTASVVHPVRNAS